MTKIENSEFHLGRAMTGGDLSGLSGTQLIALMAAGPEAFEAVINAQGLIERYQELPSTARYTSTEDAVLADLSNDELTRAADGLVFLTGVVPTSAALRPGRRASGYGLLRRLTDSVDLLVRGGDVSLSGASGLSSRCNIEIAYDYQPAEWVRASCQAVSAEIDGLLDRCARLEGRGGVAHGCTYRASRLIATDYERYVMDVFGACSALQHLGASREVADLIEEALFQRTHAETVDLLVAAVEAAIEPCDTVEIQVVARKVWGATPMGHRVIAAAQRKGMGL